MFVCKYSKADVSTSVVVVQVAHINELQLADLVTLTSDLTLQK